MLHSCFILFVCSVDAVSRLASSIKFLESNPTVRGIGVRLLGRILGRDLSLLLRAVAGTNAKGERCSEDEIVFSGLLVFFS